MAPLTTSKNSFPNPDFHYLKFSIDACDVFAQLRLRV